MASSSFFFPDYAISAFIRPISLGGLLVGPRPCIPYEVEEYQTWHKQRLQAVGGITGLWQVSARSAADFDGMCKLDIAYIEQRSLMTDIKLILKTPIVMIFGRGGF